MNLKPRKTKTLLLLCLQEGHTSKIVQCESERLRSSSLITSIFIPIVFKNGEKRIAVKRRSLSTRGQNTAFKLFTAGMDYVEYFL